MHEVQIEELERELEARVAARTEELSTLSTQLLKIGGRALGARQGTAR